MPIKSSKGKWRNLCLLLVWMIATSTHLISEEIMVTLPSYLWITEELAQDVAKVGSLLQPGEGHHLSSIPPVKLEMMRDSKIWFGVGNCLEESILAVISDSVTYVDLRDGSSICNSSDPHFWLSLSCLRDQVEFMAEKLCQIFQEQEEKLKENLSRVLSKIDMTKREIQHLLSSSEFSIICSHDALRYFCNEFQIDYLSFDANGYEPSFSDLEKLVTNVDESLPSLLVMIEGHHEGLSRALAENLNVPIFSFNPDSRDVLEQLTLLAKALIQKREENG
ncbi:metal ABC transporter solute-binding protein, Zn/Mn family [Candidatus Similichlamydia epinepheli]|uniref:metal ABC transporter solute-binding protein, Zn/Mn family n=1 Tax=Candidatus Similichlamydia epinepheli TaxID=1903953 RepID=UPI00130038EA|nr:zinc ABC transporter substrate-binding protein [Candidatus Similichlamydia epinepheli]